MLVERQAKISTFKKAKYYVVRILSGELTAESQRIEIKEKAFTLQTACNKNNAVCSSVIKEQKTINPPKLFDLTALQREANRMFGLTAQQTLDTAQKLYEKKLLTYPRTDSRYITSDMENRISELVNCTSECMPFSEIPSVINSSCLVNDAKVSDHHAIIPTVEIKNIESDKLSENERKTMLLVCLQLLCAVGEKHVYETVTAMLQCSGAEFTAKGKTIVVNGWKALQDSFRTYFKIKDDDKGKDEKEPSTTLPLVAEGQSLTVSSDVQERSTQPPKPYTEATLLSAMETAGASDTDKDAERRGLGTPATRAAIIEKLVNGGFAQRKGKQIISTADGDTLISVLPEALTSPALTAEWENQLTQIAKGKSSAETFMSGIIELVNDVVRNATVPETPSFLQDREVIGACPRCSSNIFENAKAFSCSNRDCGFVLWKVSKFWTNNGKKGLTKANAVALVSKGKAKMAGFVSQKTGKTFDATVIIEDTGQYVNLKFDFNRGD